MEQELQRLLNEQWDALESRDRRVRTIRREIADKLQELAESRANDAVDLDARLLADREYLQKEQAAATKRKHWEDQLAIELGSDLHQSIVSLTQQVEDLDVQISQLQIKRSKLDQEVESLKSIFSSRTAKIYDFLVELDAIHPAGSHDTVDLVKTRVCDQERQQKSFNRESIAAKEGLKLWNQVCARLDELDSELRGMSRDQLPQMAFLLEQAASKIQESLEFAEDNGWSVLIIAIGHEIQILNETKAAIKRAV